MPIGDMVRWGVVAVTAVVAVGWMVANIWRLYSRKATQPATVRQATAAESGLYGAEVPEGARVFDAFAYRVGARFAGRTRIVFDGETVSVAGPRAPKGLYAVWIWVQGLPLALVAPAAVAAVIFLDWRWALAALALLVASVAAMAVGAGVWPGMGEVEWIGTDGYFKALEFPRALANDVRIGRGWARGGLSAIVLLYERGIDQIAKTRAVSFYAPDEDGREVVYALQFLSDDAAQEVAGLLGR
jgi:hypothetical protein